MLTYDVIARINVAFLAQTIIKLSKYIFIISDSGKLVIERMEIIDLWMIFATFVSVLVDSIPALTLKWYYYDALYRLANRTLFIKITLRTITHQIHSIIKNKVKNELAGKYCWWQPIITPNKGNLKSYNQPKKQNKYLILNILNQFHLPCSLLHTRTDLLYFKALYWWGKFALT